MIVAYLHMNPNTERKYARASLATADSLKTVAQSLTQEDLSRLSLPEIDKAVEIVAKMVPAGNVPGVILNGLAHLAGRRPAARHIQRDINMLFQGVEQVLDHAAYGAFFAGPAAVIWGYQNLLKLAGKNPEDAFPQGTWQFYVDYALREDTARHTNETHGFDTILQNNHITLNQIDRITALMMACSVTLESYPALLENEWRERIYIQQINEVTDNRFSHAYRRWEQERPYMRRSDAGQLKYAQYRRVRFDAFLQPILNDMSDSERQQWQTQIDTLKRDALPKYLRQMSIWSYLQPEAHNETHVDLRFDQLTIGLIWRGAYYLIPLWQSDGIIDVLTMRAHVAAIVGGAVQGSPANLTNFIHRKRASLAQLESSLNDRARAAWQSLRTAPILINADKRPHQLPLAEIRQAERGLGDHALTLLDTGQTLVFDQSHIYFDGAWGAALAEIITNEALSWARYLASLPQPSAQADGIQPLDFNLTRKDNALIDSAPSIAAEITAESDELNVKAMLGLRRMFKQRSDLLNLTVNDLLILYRAIHAMTYQPSVALVEAIDSLIASGEHVNALRAARDALTMRENPAILVPIDASRSNPSERLYPMSFTVPLDELDLISLHERAIAALDAYEAGGGERSAQYQEFDRLQREYLATLAGFGAVLSRAKEIAASGEGASTGSIRLLAHMPRPLQRLLDEIPSKIDLLNDIIKGREVMSNVGAVAPTSTLTRFITAKDDNEKKTLAWGIITDANGVMRISLRDFRPHVAALKRAGLTDLAGQITQDYLSTFVHGLNAYVADLRKITVASRETRMIKDFQYDA